jgi:hypothetical protein
MRIRDLYELGGLQRGKYVARHDAIDAALSALVPELIPALDLDLARSVLKAQRPQRLHDVLDDRDGPEAKRQFLTLIFKGAWPGRTPRPRRPAQPSFLPFFDGHAGERGPGPMGVKYGSDGTPTRVRHHLSRFAPAAVQPVSN